MGCRRPDTVRSIQKTLTEMDEDDGHHDRAHRHRQDAVEEEVYRVAVGSGRCYGSPPGVVALGVISAFGRRVAASPCGTCRSVWCEGGGGSSRTWCRR